MRNLLQLKKALYAWFGVLWTATAYAAQNSFTEGIESIPLRAIGYALILSCLGGLAATTTKITKADAVIKNIWIEIFKDILCSILAGTFIFCLTSWAGLSFWLQIIFISLAGYSGSRLLERGIENGLFPWVDKVFGNSSIAPKQTEETPP